MIEEIHVALAFDDAYAPHGATTIASLLANAGDSDRLHVHVIDTGMTEVNRRLVAALVEATPHNLRFHAVPDKFFRGFPTTHHAASTYARLALPELLPNLDRVLYLDADVVVLGSLSQLWHTELEGKQVAATKDAMTFFQGAAVEYWRSIGLGADANYFSAGVLLMNLGLWRSLETCSHVREWIRKHHALMRHSDQCALNAVLATSVKLVHLRWNLQTPLILPVRFGWGCTIEMEEAVRSPAIIHYATRRKPWHSQYKVPMASQYWRYRKQFVGNVSYRPLPLRLVMSRGCEEAWHLYRGSRALARRILGRFPNPR